MYLCPVFDVLEISRQILPVISLSKYMHPLGPIILLVTDFSKSYTHWMEFCIQIITTTWILIVVCWSHSTRRSVIVIVVIQHLLLLWILFQYVIFYILSGARRPTYLSSQVSFAGNFSFPKYVTFTCEHIHLRVSVRMYTHICTYTHTGTRIRTKICTRFVSAL